MGKSKGFTLLELLIVMAIIAILIGVAVPRFRGMQDEARRTRAQRDVRVIAVAIESYYKNHGNIYPAEANYQTTLINAVPWVMDHEIYDPFGATSTTQFTYKLSTGDPATAKYYIIYSLGVNRNGTASVDNNGTVTASNDAIWKSNGYLP